MRAGSSDEAEIAPDPLYEVMRCVGRGKSGSLEVRLAALGALLLTDPAMTGTRRRDLERSDLADRAAKRLREARDRIPDADQRFVATACLAMDAPFAGMPVGERMAALPAWINDRRYRDLAPKAIGTLILYVRTLPIEAEIEVADLPRKLEPELDRLFRRLLHELNHLASLLFRAELDNLVSLRWPKTRTLQDLDFYARDAADVLTRTLLVSLAVAEIRDECVVTPPDRRPSDTLLSAVFGADQVPLYDPNELPVEAQWPDIVMADLRFWARSLPSLDPIFMEKGLRAERSGDVAAWTTFACSPATWPRRLLWRNRTSYRFALHGLRRDLNALLDVSPENGNRDPFLDAVVQIIAECRYDQEPPGELWRNLGPKRASEIWDERRAESLDDAKRMWLMAGGLYSREAADSFVTQWSQKAPGSSILELNEGFR
ncbi:MAG: hypothetical protein M3O32_00390 [Actinomycetota bacterium]|nr:hypothetical protein [Actinomycetota bacterium]